MATLEITRRTLTNWLKSSDAVPAYQEAGKKGKLWFDLSEVKAWMERVAATGDVGPQHLANSDNPDSPDSPEKPGNPKAGKAYSALVTLAKQTDIELKKLKVRAEKVKVTQLEGDSVSVSEVTRAHSQMVLQARSLLEQIPGSYAARLADLGDARLIEAELTRAIRAALLDLSEAEAGAAE